jgi:Arc/MetJ-type ribon-helix-helix transcriptional regulator
MADLRFRPGGGSAEVDEFGDQCVGTSYFDGYYLVINRVAIGLRVSASLPAEDVEFLDAFRRANGFHSRSSVLHLAIYMLRGAQLTSSYEAAWAEWKDMPDSVDWAPASADPTANAPTDPEPA